MIAGGIALAVAAFELGPGALAIFSNTAILNTLMGIGVSAALSGTAGLLNTPADPSNIGPQGQLPVETPNPLWRIVYGIFQFAGTVTFVDGPILGWAGTGSGNECNNQYIQRVHTLTAHQIAGFIAVVIDGQTYNFGTDLCMLTTENNGGAEDVNAIGPVGMWGFINNSNPWLGAICFAFDSGDPGNSTQPFPYLVTGAQITGQNGPLVIGSTRWPAGALQRGRAKVHVLIKFVPSNNKLAGPYGGAPQPYVLSTGRIPTIEFKIMGRIIKDYRVVTAWQADTTYPAYGYVLATGGGSGSGSAGIPIVSSGLVGSTISAISEAGNVVSVTASGNVFTTGMKVIVSGVPAGGSGLDNSEYYNGNFTLLAAGNPCTYICPYTSLPATSGGLISAAEAICTTSAPHGLTVGETFTISGATVPAGAFNVNNGAAFPVEGGIYTGHQPATWTVVTVTDAYNFLFDISESLQQPTSAAMSTGGAIDASIGGAGGSGDVFVTIGGGTSGATIPNFAGVGIGGTVTDGSVTWLNVGFPVYAAGSGQTGLNAQTSIKLGGPGANIAALNGGTGTYLVADAWQGSTAYAANAVIEAPIGVLQMAQSAFTSGVTRPPFQPNGVPPDLVPGTVISETTGGGSWVCLGRSMYATCMPDDDNTTNQGGFSNPALVVADYLQTPKNQFGLGTTLTGDSIDTIIAAANICDEPVVIEVFPPPAG
jgi:hypothetical protein